MNINRFTSWVQSGNLFREFLFGAKESNLALEDGLGFGLLVSFDKLITVLCPISVQDYSNLFGAIYWGWVLTGLAN